ncbi:MAG: hypothetical protein QXT31_07425, partial [Candidatus Bathyarchaeia archaeon]
YQTYTYQTKPPPQTYQTTIFQPPTSAGTTMGETGEGGGIPTIEIVEGSFEWWQKGQRITAYEAGIPVELRFKLKIIGTYNGPITVRMRYDIPQTTDEDVEGATKTYFISASGTPQNPAIVTISHTFTPQRSTGLLGQRFGIFPIIDSQYGPVFNIGGVTGGTNKRVSLGAEIFAQGGWRV